MPLLREKSMKMNLSHLGKGNWIIIAEKRLTKKLAGEKRKKKDKEFGRKH